MIRTLRAKARAAAHITEVLLSTQWNIERGYKLHQIVQELKQIDADVIALQEVDIGCERSESIDTGDLNTDWGSHCIWKHFVLVYAPHKCMFALVTGKQAAY